MRNIIDPEILSKMKSLSPDTCFFLETGECISRSKTGKYIQIEKPLSLGARVEIVCRFKYSEIL